jgi:hypothetical protein
VASGLLQVSLDGAENCGEIRNRIRRFIKNGGRKEGSWILARDFDNNIFPEHKYPSLAELDSLCPDIRFPFSTSPDTWGFIIPQPFCHSA